ncbi:hypothetical protein NAC44_17165 [Allorhizobium sp. BGMRC 0089]|uniref:hypothetical protein n=1 Tax=Allorhizobium sonneratiae TaxID=2934936 RepID=UPI002033D788|nr:hypothetical protein [Allorhizobium sonneratiae]MCM2294059.1 hypothetical protein [Allorhizobium sonneratiae]
MSDDSKQSPLKSPLGARADVQTTADDFNPGAITALVMADEPYEGREEALCKVIEELEARVKAGRRGEDLQPLLQEARTALETVRRHNRS